MGDFTKNFSISEFAKFNPQVPDLIQVLRLQKFREELGSSVTLNWFENVSRFKEGNVYRMNLSHNNVSYKKFEQPFTETLTLHLDIDDMIPIYGKAMVHNPGLFNIDYYNSLPNQLKSVMIAFSQVGFTEGENNKNPYGEMLGLDHLPWCMLFVQWVWRTGDFKEEFYTKNYAHVKSVWDAIPVKKRLEDASSGDGIFWNYGGTQGHAGLVVFNDTVNKIVYTIEGNSSDSVKYKKYTYDKLKDTASRSQLLGIGSPTLNPPQNVDFSKSLGTAQEQGGFNLNR